MILPQKRPGKQVQTRKLWNISVDLLISVCSSFSSLQALKKGCCVSNQNSRSVPKNSKNKAFQLLRYVSSRMYQDLWSSNNYCKNVFSIINHARAGRSYDRCEPVDFCEWHLQEFDIIFWEENPLPQGGLPFALDQFLKNW